MGNQHSGAHAASKQKKNVHWKTAGRPAPPGKPEIIPISSEEELNAITLRWKPPAHDGGSPLVGYQVECNRLGTPAWIRTAPPIVLRPELVLSGLEPPHQYQFRVAALNRVGRSDYGELSDVLTVNSERETHNPPSFLQHLETVTVLENDKTEFRVTFAGTPTPTVAWFKDGYEIFSSRRTAITNVDNGSVLVFHQTLPSDEGEIKCTITNRAGHAVSKGRLILEAAPKLRYPRQYEDGLLYEINETVFLKSSIVGKPTPLIEWRHDGHPIVADERVEIMNTPKFSVLKIHSAKRSDRGEYQIHASNSIGEDTAAFLVTITAPPDAPRRVSVTRQVDKSVTLDWEPPEDDGGCRIGNYVVEYYRSGWNVWLKATTSRKTNVTLFDLIEGSEYRFRVKAESPYGMSAPSVESAPVRIPGRAVDMEFLAVESRIINDVLLNRDGEETNEPPVTPVPRRKRNLLQPKEKPLPTEKRKSPAREKSPAGSNEFMLVLYPESEKSGVDKSEKRKSFQLELEDALSPPPISLSAPELSSRCILPFKALRNSVSSTELLHERAMARFYKAVAMKEEQKNKQTENNTNTKKSIQENADIPLKNTKNESSTTITPPKDDEKKPQPISVNFATPEIIIKTDSVENKEYGLNSRQSSRDSEQRWQSISFDEDYTASTVSTDGEYSDDGSLNEDMDRRGQYADDEETYNPRDKSFRSSPFNESEEDAAESNVKPMPVPDPNFIPKPILKKRDTDTIEMKKERPKKEEKMTMLKKLTKMPMQNPFPFPKILAKRETEKPTKEAIDNKSNPTTNKVPQKNEETDEGRTVIEYYGNIVKEYGSQKRTAPPLYLNTDDLKTVAEIQQSKKSDISKPKSTDVTPEDAVNKQKQQKNKQLKPQTRVQNSLTNQIKPKSQLLEKRKAGQKVKRAPSPKPPEKVSEKHQDKPNPRVLLKKTERATIVIPINYQELEQQAKVTVRSAIDYTVDFCLLLLAFWAYFFKDERLAIPFLILIIYRQVQETVMTNIPRWTELYAPNWLKAKNS